MERCADVCVTSTCTTRPCSALLMSRTRPALGPPPAECCSALFFLVQAGKDSSHPTAYCFQTGSLQLHSSPKNLLSSWVSLCWRKRRRAQTACSLIFVCLSVHVNVRAHMEVNTSNLALKECSVFCSRPSLFPSPDNNRCSFGRLCCRSAGGGETQRSAATRGHAGGEINYCSRRLRNLGLAVGLRDVPGLSCCTFRTDGIYGRWCVSTSSAAISCCWLDLLPLMVIWSFLDGSHAYIKTASLSYRCESRLQVQSMNNYL